MDDELRRYLNAVLALLALVAATVLVAGPLSSASTSVADFPGTVALVALLATPLYLLAHLYVVAGRPDPFGSG